MKRHFTLVHAAACASLLVAPLFLCSEDPATAVEGSFSPPPSAAPAPAAIGRYAFPNFLFSQGGAQSGGDPLNFLGALSTAVPSLSSDEAFRLNPLLNDDLVVFYGSPLSDRMGILGRFPRPDLDARLTSLAAQYDAANGDRGVQKAFYLIYGTCWPGGDIGLLSDKLTADWIEWARARGIVVFLDHQIGKYTVDQAMAKLLPWLRYPNVHLAIDPEWRTTKPMQEIGSITGDELNAAQRIMSRYMVEHAIPGSRILVVHEFNGRMIRGKDNVRADWDGVVLVHCADGFGPPAVKYDSYQRNALAQNIPLKGFKLFFSWGVPGAGFDSPLLSPAQVMALKPVPSLIMYQ